MTTIFNPNNHNSHRHSGQARFSIVFSSLAIALLIGGCSQSPEYAEEQSSADVESSEYASDEQMADNTASAQNEKSGILKIGNLGGASEQTLGSQITDIEVAGKTLLINARANFKVADVVKSSAAIETLTRQQGGYVALSNITNVENDSQTFVKGAQNITLTTYYRQANMTVRIPKSKVTAFLKQIQQQVAFLNEQEFTAQDVTLDIYREQLAANLNSDMAAELTQQRLDTQNAKDQSSNVSAITATYAARQQQQYAKLQQLNIADKVKYSTIDLTFTQPASSYKEVTQNLEVLIEAEQPSFAEQVTAAFKQGWDTLKSVTVTLIGLWWLLMVGGIFYLLYQFIKKSYKRLMGYKARQK